MSGAIVTKQTISVRPVRGQVCIELPYRDTVMTWEDAAEFMELLRSSIKAAQAVVGDVRLHALSPLLRCETHGMGKVVLLMPRPTKTVPWQDAFRFMNEIAARIAEAKIDQSKDWPLYDPERQLAHGQIKLRR